MTNTARVRNLTHRAWKYFVEALEQPSSIAPAVLHTLRGVHLGEFLNLKRAGFRDAGIRTVIDVGAHAGEFASAAGAVLPGVGIYAFEPLPGCFDRLRARLARHHDFEAFNVAIGAERGEVEFLRSSFTKASSVLPMAQLHKAAFPWSATCAAIRVAMSKLDDYLPRMTLQPKVLLKIDVQGYEHNVLRGARQTLQSVDYVLVEVSFELLYEGQASFDEVYGLLKEAGFSYAGNLDQLRSPLDDRILQADALFVTNSGQQRLP